ncbi:plasmid partitioning protein RepB [Bartonella sp. HY406]|uniref:plasmid partitioning protein RepB n=1 Tax=Bartonella sp. HY406 TaxID=2979331 RepID=UPI0021C9A6FD|nr:plasmid partitioning protein RepB [Bartonella sp. HY406]UXN04945.1 plasmid partitioning protein RepB [Bartonella sp. HY406]
MSRKNPFANLDMSSLNKEEVEANRPKASKTGYAMTGAAKAVVRSIEEMAENTKKLMDGETIITLDPNLLDASFVSDRLSQNDEAYRELLEAIKEQGQLSPILVRPHEEQAGRYMVVFGHRRAQVAKELGLQVKAVVKSLDDVASAVAQGQENSARANLSFIERAFFAQNLAARGLSRQVIKSALSLDDAMLSKMLSVMEIMPQALLAALGAAKNIGRDKWLSLRQIILNPAFLDRALEYVKTDEFIALGYEQRFDDLHQYLVKYQKKSAAKTNAKSKAKGQTSDNVKSAVKAWQSDDKKIDVAIKPKPKALSLEFNHADSKAFGEWIGNNLSKFYEDYLNSQKS